MQDDPKMKPSHLGTTESGSQASPVAPPRPGCTEFRQNMSAKGPASETAAI